MSQKPAEDNGKKRREVLPITFELIVDHAAGDKTIRPAGPEIPRHWVRPQHPRQLPTLEQERPEMS